MRGRLSRTLLALAVALTAAGSALAAKPEKGAYYSGDVSGCEGICPSVELQVSHTGKKVKVTVDNWQAECQSGPGDDAHYNYTSSTETDKLKIRKKGKFSAKGTYSETPPRPSYGGPQGTTAAVTMKIKGKFKSKDLAKGFYKVKVVLTDSNGVVRDTCTDKEHWKAERGGLI